MRTSYSMQLALASRFSWCILVSNPSRIFWCLDQRGWSKTYPLKCELVYKMFTGFKVLGWFLQRMSTFNDEPSQRQFAKFAPMDLRIFVFRTQGNMRNQYYFRVRYFAMAHGCLCCLFVFIWITQSSTFDLWLPGPSWLSSIHWGIFWLACWVVTWGMFGTICFCMNWKLDWINLDCHVYSTVYHACLRR